MLVRSVIEARTGDAMRPSTNLHTVLLTVALTSLSFSGARSAWAEPAATDPTVTAVVDSATYSTNLCPGMLAEVFGTNFGSTATGVTVTVGGKQASVQNVTPSQMAVELPMDAPIGSTTMIVTVAGATSAPFSLTTASYAPVFLIPGGTGSGAAGIYTQKGVLVTPAAPAKPGDVLLAFALGLGPTNPATPTGAAPATAATAATVTLTAGGVAVTVQFAGIPATYAGIYQITFAVPPGLQGDQPLVLTVGGVKSSPATLSLFGITAIVSNASFASAGTVSAGGIVTLYGNGLGSANVTTGFPGTNFQGVSVSFNGRSAPLFHLNGSVNSADLLVPEELGSSGTATVQLTTPTGTSPNYTVNLAASTPGLYRIADPSTKGRFNIIAQFANTAWLAMPASMATALSLPGNCGVSVTNPLAACAQPAAPGDYLVIYVTGLGIATPNGNPAGTPLATGLVAPADGSVLYETPTLPAVTVGGIAAKALYSGLVPGYAGLFQVDIQVPTGAAQGDDVPVAISMSGGAADTATVSVHSK
jgi:uncharacterized protein (TIGR03437 family)